MLSNSVSGTRQPSGNGVAWSASISPSSPHLSSGGGGLIFSCACADCMAFFCFFFFYRFVPKYFEKDIQSGVPTLTQAGRVALEAELKYEDEVAHADAGERHDNDGGSAS
jgi:hypothetical protein